MTRTVEVPLSSRSRISGYDPRGGEYYARELAAGKGKKGALRCPKRRLSDAVFRTLVQAQQLRQVAGPEGHSGLTKSCATDRSPMVSTSEKPLTRPATPHATTRRRKAVKTAT